MSPAEARSRAYCGTDATTTTVRTTVRYCENMCTVHSVFYILRLWAMWTRYAFIFNGLADRYNLRRTARLGKGCKSLHPMAGTLSGHTRSVRERDSSSYACLMVIRHKLNTNETNKYFDGWRPPRRSTNMWRVAGDQIEHFKWVYYHSNAICHILYIGVW